MKTRIAPALGVLLVLALLVGGLVWFAGSRGFTADDLRDLVDPPPPEQCDQPDPTTSGCLTPSALRLHDALVGRFGEPGPSAPVRAITCWSEHAWNPSSDHPAGRACDAFPAGYGDFPAGQDLEDGWAVATWLRENASELRVRYVIWQGRIWYRGTGDSGEGRENWGRPYDGGGVYDPADATGGHFDHVHVSVRR
ncbi:hypothetical protein [Pseudonocardia sp. HH130629-09]|uniref:hypothetical protein n=1 Tax=Pseudonocardia sp. HH130629-09 TaxID=1641402 RepID=UPI0006CB5634|nr:hypothetical protein [Pseudonocardia sp. HH130629-09]ALE86462.1 hypothetical protein XF36_27730 [Pseudonocardia sp. HH130629-09]